MIALEWPQWMFHTMRHEPVAVPLIAVCIILAIWGLSLQRSAFITRGPSPLRWFNPRRWIVDTFEYWLGAFMLGDAALYGLLGVATLREESVDLWVVLFFAAVAFPAFMAMRHWLKDRVPASDP